MTRWYLTLMFAFLFCPAMWSQEDYMVDTVATVAQDSISIQSVCPTTDNIALELTGSGILTLNADSLDYYGKLTIYDYPYSWTLSMPDWKRLWVNTSVLIGAGVATMVVLEALPADATAWNKTENAKTPMFKRWWRNVRNGPHWDGDNPVFNYVLHPYAGAAYYMGARSLGFNCWGSFVYGFCISTFFWEYGFESFNEIPSVQDLIITPVVGSLVGEAFYLIKRKIVGDGYRLWGSKALGYSVAFLVDPLNEVVGYIYGDQRKSARRTSARNNVNSSFWIAPTNRGLQGGISLFINF